MSESKLQRQLPSGWQQVLPIRPRQAAAAACAPRREKNVSSRLVPVNVEGETGGSDREIRGGRGEFAAPACKLQMIVAE